MKLFSSRLFPWIVSLIVFVLLTTPLLAQQSVSPRNRHERLLCVVPMVGSGTYEDPRRPMFAPVAGQDQDEAGPSPEGLLGYSYQLSDDEQYALVEFVALDRKAFKEILADKTIKSFERGKARRSDIEREFRKYKQDLNLDTLGVSLP